MKKLLIILLQTIPAFSFAQTTIDLDNKNGFKEFILGDDYSKWSSETQYLRGDGDVKVYKYGGNCCNKLFDYTLNEIELGFLDSKLVVIYIETENFQKPYEQTKEFTKWRSNDFEKINNSLKSLFGEPTGSNTDDDITFYWQGKKVFLRSTYKYLGVREGDKQIVFIFSLDYLRKQKTKGF